MAARAHPYGGGGGGSTRLSKEEAAPIYGTRVRCTLRSYQQQWGFAVSPSFNGDLFIHGDNAPGLQLRAGMEIELTIGEDQRQRLTGLEITEPGADPGGSYGAYRSSGSRSAPVPRRPAARLPPPPPSISQSHARGAPREPPSRIYGTVRSWKGDWGFLVGQDIDGDVFCHMDAIASGTTPWAGAQAEFSIAVDGNGRRAAADVYIYEQRGAPAYPPPRQAPRSSYGQADDGVFEGTVKSWRDQWGFIVSPQVEGDIFCHQDGTVNRMPLNTGDAVRFRVAPDAKGRRCASDVELIDPSYSYSAGPSYSAPPRGGWEAAGDDGVFEGTVKSWRDQWGFIVSPQVEGDVFCHQDVTVNRMPLTTGDAVRFRVAPDKKGRRCASDVELIDSYSAGPAPAESSYKAARHPAASTQRGAAGDGPDPRDLIGETVYASFRSWKNDWGFLVSDHWRGDLFAHKDALVSGFMPEVGMELMVTVGSDRKGRPCGTEIQPG
jgi:cold shock CspA family protein